MLRFAEVVTVSQITS